MRPGITLFLFVRVLLQTLFTMLIIPQNHQNVVFWSHIQSRLYSLIAQGLRVILFSPTHTMLLNGLSVVVFLKDCKPPPMIDL